MVASYYILKQITMPVTLWFFSSTMIIRMCILHGVSGAYRKRNMIYICILLSCISFCTFKL